MNFERGDQDQPFARMEKPGFKDEVRRNFADRLEDRASDPEYSGPGNPLLAEFAETIRRGEKLPRNPYALEIFRGTFMIGGPMEKRLTHVEIDSLEKFFFES